MLRLDRARFQRLGKRHQRHQRHAVIRQPTAAVQLSLFTDRNVRALRKNGIKMRTDDQRSSSATTAPAQQVPYLVGGDLIQTNAPEFAHHEFPALFLLKSRRRNFADLDLLLQRISNIIQEKCSIDANAIVTTQQRQKEKLLECVEYLKSIDLCQPLEITAQKIRGGVAAIEYITGKITLDDVLDKIFSTFCIGK